MKYKVIHVISHLKVGGAETLITNYTLNMDPAQFEIVIISLGAPENTINEIKLKNKNIKVYFLTNEEKYPNSKNVFARLINRFLKQKYFNKIISDENPDIIHSHLYVNPYLVLLPDNKNIKYFYTIHSNLNVLFARKNVINNIAIRYLLKKRNMIPIALHNNMQSQMNRRFGISSTIVLENAIDVNKFIAAKSKRNDTLKYLGLNKETFILGHIGRFHPVKNHKFLIHLFYNLQKEKENSHLLLIGDGETRACIEKLVKDYNIENKVTLLGEQSDVSSYLAVMDAFIFPSFHEGFGNVLLEAQAAGVKCIASDTVPVETKVTDLVTFVSLNQPIEKWINCILDDKVINDDISGLHKHDIRTVLSKLEKIYCNNNE